MKKVLVLGGGGFIGRNIVQFLIDRGDTFVTAADINIGSNWEGLASNSETSERFDSLVGDFSNMSTFDKLKKRYDEIYMLAAVVGVNRTIKDPQDVIRINTNLTMNTLEWISKNPIKRLFFSSSSENYAGTSDLYNIEIPTPESIPLTITDIKHPRWTYAMTKMHGESAFYHSAKTYGYDCRIVRYQNIIGPEMGFGHAIPHIVERFMNKDNLPFKIYGHDQTRAFCFIDDAVAGSVGAMESHNSKGEIYHIGNDQEVTMRELTTFIGSLMNYEGDYKNAITYPGSVDRRCPDISKAAKDFDYKPKTNWQNSVEYTVAWYRNFFRSGKVPLSGGFESPELITEKSEL